MSGCGTAESQAQAALAEYQAAKAAGDVQASRLALLRLVTADDSVADYWLELGKVQIQLGNYGDAVYAFTRAFELDRSNVEVLATLTHLSMLSGNRDVMEERVRQLELLAPSHPVVNLTYGYLALRKNDYEEAHRRADLILGPEPFEPNAKLLKAHTYMVSGKLDDAMVLLTDQIRVRPEDIGALRVLLTIQRQTERWSEAAATARQLSRLMKNDEELKLEYIEVSFRANEIEAARAASLELLGPNASGEVVEKVLDIWERHWRTPRAVEEARRLASAAGPHQTFPYAVHLNKVGRPEDAAALLGGKPQIPVTRANSSLNSILAESLALLGRASEAKTILDSVLAVEPDHVHALRARVNLHIKTGAPKAAVRDAQRLITIEPNSAEDRLRLAQAYAAADEPRQVDRTLWNAFHDIPGNEKLYLALRSHLAKTKGTDAARRLADEFASQRQKALVKDIV